MHCCSTAGTRCSWRGRPRRSCRAGGRSVSEAHQRAAAQGPPVALSPEVQSRAQLRLWLVTTADGTTDLVEGVRAPAVASRPFGGGGEQGASPAWFSRHGLLRALAPRRTSAVTTSGAAAAAAAVPIAGAGLAKRPSFAPPPLEALKRTVCAADLASLVERGFAVVDGALPRDVCRKLRSEMETLSAQGQLWNSKSYAKSEGAPHRHIEETTLDYKEARRWAPTFARVERDGTLLELLRPAVPGLARLAGQHLRIQINAGHGGCYTMHTDAGSVGGDGGGQRLLVTALFYLNPGWEEAHGGALRVFPYPHAPRALAPLEGRLVLFEPRMVHDVLPAWHRRCCFTLWCHAADLAPSPTVDHDTLDAITVEPSLAAAAALAEDWRRRTRQPLPYDAARMPRGLRAFFLPELRPWLVRAVVGGADEVRQVAESHAEGAERDEMAAGIAGFHARVAAANPPWLLALARALCAAPDLPPAQAARCDEEAEAAIGIAAAAVADPAAGSASGLTGDEAMMSLAELKRLAHRHCPWWL